MSQVDNELAVGKYTKIRGNPIVVARQQLDRFEQHWGNIPGAVLLMNLEFGKVGSDGQPADGWCSAAVFTDTETEPDREQQDDLESHGGMAPPIETE